MSDADNPSFAGFGKLVPGFDFLQNLAKQAAGSATQKIPQLPNLGNWVAPTLNVEELDKRIEELKTVQFWLDQNAMALKATIQALEVQKMTLATLKGMNFNMGDVANAFKLKVADTVAGGIQKAAEKAQSFQGLEIPPTSYEAGKPGARKKSPPKTSKSTKAAEPAPGVVDPMQWWGALTQQFQNIATTAMQDAAKKAAISTTKNMAAGLAKDAVKSATGMAKDMARGMAGSAGRTVAQGARSAMNTALRSSQAWPTPATSAAPAAAPRAPAKSKPAARKTARKTAR
ncbi:MAG TPA: PhaM family polyhydroxyalkanoate granule multifunctional regulatory protein [Polaromonas sp.]|uniref:PhaM family polyhydroxyalkanoate granule multifunctional regulatory protein n=1 Tax=Polaromonas sp. TaxID=1869339 RepID=UPI002D228AA3|nr:PhaM family polyhydroxyalkanoate granule multifunctional regulatory protein [Polaromonas sp.]HYW57097.1 PhaM family polyhydroxyalkanoate granule multifunctional regulatory protein [Polaromonas sp.]